MNSLFVRLLGSYAAVLFTAIFVIATALAYFYSESVFEAREDELVENGLALASDQSLLVPQARPLLNVRVRAMSDTLKAGIIIANRQGGVIVTTLSPEQAERLRLQEEDVVQVLQQGATVTRRGYEEALGEAVVTAMVPIATGDGIVGAVILHAPIRGTHETIQRALRLLIAAGLLAVVAGVLVSYVLSRRIALPIREMTQASLEMATGDFQRRVSASEPGELGALGTAFNQLASQLGQTIDELKQEQKKLASILEGMSEGVVAVDAAENIIAANPAAAELFGVERRDDASGIQASAGYQLTLTALRAALQGEGAKEELHLGNAVVSVHTTPLAGDDGTVTGAVAILHDISERHRLDRMRRDFLANVSHELRTPLTSIRGFAQAILEGMVTEEKQVRRYLHVIMDEGLRLIRLVNTILDLSRLESKAVALQRQPVNVSEVIEDVAESLEPMCNDRGIRLRHDIGELPRVHADRDRLAQIVMNLLENAVRHSPRDEEVVVAARADAQWVTVSIEDRGPGIPDEELPYIWERFYKVDKARRFERGVGTGLGLVIAKELVEMHQGRVGVENLDVGARFWFQLPVAASLLESARLDG